MAISVTWRGASGQSYTFETFPDGTSFNEVSGVYIFCRPLASGNWEPLYVGETQSFKQRLNNCVRSHDGYARSVYFGMSHIGALVVAGDAERLRIETDLRHGLNPPANAQNALGGFRP